MRNGKWIDDIEDGAAEAQAPIFFEDRVVDPASIPCEWYTKRSEPDLVSLLKSELSRGSRDAPAAMVLELLSYPKTWEDVAFEEAAYVEDFGDLGPVDKELNALVRRTFPGATLPRKARYFDCYKAILKGSAPG